MFTQSKLEKFAFTGILLVFHQETAGIIKKFAQFCNVYTNTGCTFSRSDKRKFAHFTIFQDISKFYANLIIGVRHYTKRGGLVKRKITNFLSGHRKGPRPYFTHINWTNTQT
jgi:hypothetical protein